MYYPHPSEELNRLFKENPYQGASPEKAKYIFVNLDANYDKDIERCKAFPLVLEYLKDGIAFWEKYGVHHPFLLSEYFGDGKFFHRSFARIGLTKKHAKKVCFFELVNVPTYGQSKLEVKDLDASKDHLKWLKKVIEGGTAQYVFIPSSVGRLMKKTGFFPWLPSKPKKINSPLKQWAIVGSTQILWHYHFSAYGKFEKGKSCQIGEIGKLLGACRVFSG